MIKNKIEFTTKNTNGDDINLVILRPSPNDNIKAQLVYNKKWAEAEKAGSPLRRNLDEIAERQDIWGERQRKRVNEIDNEVLSLERKLRGGSNGFSTLVEAREAALRMRLLRNERLNLLRDKNSLDVNTAESFAETERMKYLVAVSVFDLDKRAFFKGYDDFVSRAEEQAAIDSFANYLTLVYGDMVNDTDMYEDTFLKKYGFANEEGRLIDKDGNLIDSQGKRVDKDFNYVDAEGNRVDVDGNRIDAEGNYVVEFSEWTSDGIAGV